MEAQQTVPLYLIRGKQQKRTLVLPAHISLQSWRCESFGKQERLLKTTLRGEKLREAKRVIEQVGLFKYVPVMELNRGLSRDPAKKVPQPPKKSCRI